MDFYTELVYGVFLRDYAISVDRNLSDSFKIMLRMFFAKFIWQGDHLSSQTFLKDTEFDPGSKQNLDSLFIAVNNIKELIEAMAQISPAVKDLNFAYVVDKFTSTYNSVALLALDYLPGLIWTLSSALNKAYLVNQKPVEAKLKSIKTANKFYVELGRLGY
jgi:hypothetical protein